MSAKPKVLITGASSGIGAVYADRFARRGHDLTLVARDAARLRDLAARLEREAGVKAEVLRADLTQADDLAAARSASARDKATEILVNNAGIAAAGEFLAHPHEIIDRLVALNYRGADAACGGDRAPAGGGRARRDRQIGSVVGFAPELGMTLYGASKAYVQYLSQGLQRELGPRGVYVQAVLPAATRTEIWGRAGLDVNSIPGVMEVEVSSTRRSRASTAAKL